MSGRGFGKLAGVVLALGVISSGCSAAGNSLPAPTTSSAPSGPPAASAPVVRAPADGTRLADFGYRHGPIEKFYLPTGARLSAAVDQENNVTAVFATPGTPEAYAFYRRSLEPAGFIITRFNDAETTLTFSGYGWTGSFTGDAATSAVLLRPA